MSVPTPFGTAAAIAADVRDGRRSCRAVIEACLAAIDAREPAVGAWALVDRDGAIAQADRLDAEGPDARSGLLRGVPVGVKDVIDVAGLPTSAGARRWARGPAAIDAPVVARLRAAGAIIVGKTVTTPYAWIDPPPTRHPFDPSRTPGGSSSGSAAAVAAGMVPIAIGTQTGGSIIRPASFCGACALKPTYGALPIAGIVPLAPSLDHPGPIAATIDDLRFAWIVLSGTTVEISWSLKPRLGVLEGPFRDRAEPAMRAAIEAACDRWATAGAIVERPELPTGFATALRDHRTVMAREAADFHRARFAEDPGDYPPEITALICEGMAISDSDYATALGGRRDLSTAATNLATRFDALVTPAAIGPAPDASTTGDHSMNSPWSFTGLPAVTFPVGAIEGLPLGVQLVGRPESEAHLIEVASWCDCVRD